MDSNSEYLSAIIDNFFVEKKDQFICQSETVDNPGWTYTTSTFSGWGGSIGNPKNLDAIAIRVRARAEAITQIKFHLTENDKNGAYVATETLDVNIPALQDAEIIWVLPEKLVDNEKYLYLSYNCNQFCDVYTYTGPESYIPQDQPQAVMTYAVNGSLLESASKMINVSGSPCRYLYAKLGTVENMLVPKENLSTSVTVEKKNINVFLPDEYDIAVNDNFQLFYRGVVQAVNPYNYSIVVTCTKGKAFPRYFEWTPTEEEVGTYLLKLEVLDDNGELLGSDTTKLNVHAPSSTGEMKNVLCIGDSLTAGGNWTREARRRFTETGGTPEGLGYNYLNFIGTNVRTAYGSSIANEGYAGWTWARFFGTDSPFYNEATGDISFKKYCEKNDFDGIDIVYILLTWNGQGTAYKTDYALDKGHFAYATRMIDKIHEEYPDAIIRCLGVQIPSQNGGMGASYGATGGYSEDYGMLVTAMNYNATLEDFCQQEKYKNFVKYVDVAGQFDTDYNMPSEQRPVNNRATETETVGTNGVHPTVNGYYQIADAVYRSLCEIFSK